MTDGPSGSPPTRHDQSRFALPETPIETGRSQPKRLPPKRRAGDGALIRRIAWGVASFGAALLIVSTAYNLLVSPEFGSLSFENGTTAAIGLLIGCFTLPATQRLALDRRRNLLVCMAVVAITPWTYQLGNRLEAAGMDLATGFNFVFEILLAVVLYRLAASRPATTSQT